MPGRGRFIVFEGGEGSGKSTQASLLASVLGAELTREPGGTRLGEMLRPLMLERAAGPIDPRSELLLMVAARAQHCAERIVPTLESGRDVVCDRFSGSTIAYQGFGRGLPVTEVKSACALATAGLDADLTLLLDVPLMVASTRRTRPLDAIESAGDGFHDRVRAGFLELARSDPRWVVVSGEGSIADVAAGIQSIVASRLRATRS
ncbi:MAG TPA: dTMP kinase [Acidimicrobiales bacterium]|nr:dTMP kinase [Acidimicrobiales bacterium]